MESRGTQKDHNFVAMFIAVEFWQNLGGWRFLMSAILYCVCLMTYQICAGLVTAGREQSKNRINCKSVSESSWNFRSVWTASASWMQTTTHWGQGCTWLDPYLTIPVDPMLLSPSMAPRSPAVPSSPLMTLISLRWDSNDGNIGMNDCW